VVTGTAAGDGLGLAVEVEIAVGFGVAVSVGVEVAVGVDVEAAGGALATIAALTDTGFALRARALFDEANLTTAATPIEPPMRAAVTAPSSRPRVDFVGSAGDVIGAEVIPAPGNGGVAAAAEAAARTVGAMGRALAADGDATVPDPASLAPRASLDAGPRRMLSPAASARASDNSAALPNRSTGSRSRARKNHASNVAGRPGTVIEGVGGGAVQIFTSKSPTLSPSKGNTPVTHLYSMTPSDHRSER
jgi:hypothetical protein